MKQLERTDRTVRTMTLAIAGMSCGACVRHVTKALDGMTGVVHVDVNLRTNEASVEHLPSLVDATSLIAAVQDAGYAAHVVETGDDSDPTVARASAAPCGCGCCGSESKRADAPWSNLGTSTIG